MVISVRQRLDFQETGNYLLIFSFTFFYQANWFLQHENKHSDDDMMICWLPDSPVERKNKLSPSNNLPAIRGSQLTSRYSVGAAVAI